jgi:hypothetical protein
MIMERILKIESIRSLRSSQYGNPRYEITFTDGTVAQTKSDASINYSITNPEFQGVTLTVYFERGKIVHVKR